MLTRRFQRLPYRPFEIAPAHHPCRPRRERPDQIITSHCKPIALWSYHAHPNICECGKHEKVRDIYRIRSITERAQNLMSGPSDENRCRNRNECRNPIPERSPKIVTGWEEKHHAESECDDDG